MNISFRFPLQPGRLSCILYNLSVCAPFTVLLSPINITLYADEKSPDSALAVVHIDWLPAF